MKKTKNKMLIKLYNKFYHLKQKRQNLKKILINYKYKKKILLLLEKQKVHKWKQKKHRTKPLEMLQNK